MTGIAEWDHMRLLVGKHPGKPETIFPARSAEKNHCMRRVRSDPSAYSCAARKRCRKEFCVFGADLFW